MKLAVIFALFAIFAVALAVPVAEEGSLTAEAAEPEKKEVEAPAQAADGKDLDTANSYLYGGYPYGGYYGGYGGYGLGYGGYYPAYGYGAYGVPAYGYGYYY